MKQFKTKFLIIGFLTGVIYTAACGGVAQSVATAVSDALSVAFDNSQSGLQSTTVQAALDELAAKVANLETKLAKAARTDVASLVIGTWEGNIIEGFLDEQIPEQAIGTAVLTFNENGTFACQITLNPDVQNYTTPFCVEAGQWSVAGSYLSLVYDNQITNFEIATISEQGFNIMRDASTKFDGFELTRVTQ